MKPRSNIVFYSSIILCLCVVFFIVAPSAYVIDKPGLTLNVLGSYDNKELIKIGDSDEENPEESNSESTKTEQSGKILMLTVSVYGGPTVYTPSAFVFSSLYTANDQITPVEAVFSPHTSKEQATKETTEQMSSSQKACVAAVENYLKGDANLDKDTVDEYLGKLNSVKFDVTDIGGPSAGLAFSLGILEKLGFNLTGNKTVAVTGTINGSTQTVGAIGGVSQKMIAAKKSGASIMLVPRLNLTELENIPSDLKVIPVDTLQDAVQILKSEV